MRDIIFRGKREDNGDGSPKAKHTSKTGTERGCQMKVTM